MQERKKIPIINETKHYFSMPPLDAGWYDEVAKDGIDKKRNLTILDMEFQIIFM